MELKSLIKKIMFMNEALGYSDNEEKLVNREYLLKDNSESFKKLEKLLINSVKYSQSQELKLGLEIILLLISHENENVKNSALTKMFVLMDDGLIQELVVKELKNKSNMGSKDVHESAEHSLDLIATEIHKFEVIDATFDTFIELKNIIIFKVSRFKFPFISSVSYDKSNSTNVSTSGVKNGLFNKLSCKLRAFNRKIDRMIPLEGIEDYNKNFIEYKKTGYLNVRNTKSDEKESLQKLADFYVSTFTERGHLRRLIALLDDDNEDIQQIGINALTEVIGSLLKDSTEKKFIKPLSSDDLEKISPFDG